MLIGGIKLVFNQPGNAVTSERLLSQTADGKWASGAGDRTKGPLKVSIKHPGDHTEVSQRPINHDTHSVMAFKYV